MVFKDVITVYNIIPQRGREPQRIQRTVVCGAFWDGTCGAAFDKRGEKEQDSVVIFIPDSPDLPHMGCGDIIVRGEHGEISSAADADNLGAEKIIITAVRDCRFGSRNMHHWEVSGK